MKYDGTWHVTHGSQDSEPEKIMVCDTVVYIRKNIKGSPEEGWTYDERIISKKEYDKECYTRISNIEDAMALQIINEVGDDTNG